MDLQTVEPRNLKIQWNLKWLPFLLQLHLELQL